jgi:ribonuclease R
MRQASYSAEYGRHFGLASTGYTHFTSPIRRYPDLVVHRLIRWALQGKDKSGLQKKLDEVAEHCSYRERIASDAERDSIKLKQIRMMQKHLGDEFDGHVNGMNDNGMFIKISDPFVEGFIPKDSMTDDFYEFNEERLVFYGKKKRRTFKIGNDVRVRVDRADLDQRILDFSLVSGAEGAEKLERLDTRKAKNADRKKKKKKRF